MKQTRPPVAVKLLAGVALLFLALPLIGLTLRAPWADLPGLLTEPSTLQALRLSLLTSLVAAILSILLGFPLAFMLARAQFAGISVVRAVATLPLVLPPVVGGVALLLVLGRTGFAGNLLDDLLGLRLFGTPVAVVLAQTFVALPFFVLTVEGGLRVLDDRFEQAAASLGASSWFALRRVTLPLVAPSILTGAVLAWARALGEFGATITFAGNLPGSTQTVPIAVFIQLQHDVRGAIALSLVLVAVSLTVVVALRDRWLLRP